MTVCLPREVPALFTILVSLVKDNGLVMDSAIFFSISLTAKSFVILFLVIISPR